MSNIISSIKKFPHGYVYTVVVEQVEIPPLTNEIISFTFSTDSVKATSFGAYRIGT